jgi:uncharacterized iron-regulated membrane protein
MSVAEAVFAILGTAVTMLSALGALLWWVYKRGQAAGAERAEDKAKINALERMLDDTRAELSALQPKRRRI